MVKFSRAEKGIRVVCFVFCCCFFSKVRFKGLSFFQDVVFWGWGGVSVSSDNFNCQIY